MAQVNDPARIVWRIDAWVLCLLIYLVLFRSRSLALPVLAVAAVTGSIIAALHPTVDWIHQLLAWLFTIVTPLILALGTRVVEAMVDDHLAFKGSRRQSAEADHAVRARTEALSRLRREMHDSLLHCLQLIASPWSVMSPSEARALCATTVEQGPRMPVEEQSARTEPIGAYLRQVLADEPCELTWQGYGERLPLLPATAIGKAARESVRNVSKHCEVPEAEIRIRSSEGTVRVQIADSGPGFNPEDTPQHRDGWQRSIVERMTSVGGEATLRRNSRGGTTISLTWPTPLPALPEPLNERARRRVSVTPIPLVIASFINMLAMHQGVSLATAIGLWTIAFAVFVAAAVALREAIFSQSLAWFLTLVATVAAAANYAWLDPGVSNGWDLWMISLSCAIILLVLPGQPFKWRGVAMGATFSIGSLLSGFLLIGFTPMITSHYGGALAILSYTGVTFILSYGATLVSQFAHQTLRLEEISQERIRADAERETIWRAWLDHASTLSLPFLRDVAEGRRHPDDPETRAMASLLEARVRDDLRLWPEATEISEQLDARRRRGWICRLNTDQIPASLRPELSALLRALPDSLPGQQLTVTAQQDVVTVTITDPGLIPEQRVAVEHWPMIVDDDFTQIRLR